MSKPRMTPLGSFDPRMVDLLVRAGSAPVRLAPGPKADSYNRIIRLRTLRSRMVEEKHPLAAQVAGVWIRWDQAAEQIVIESRDRGLDDFQEVLPDGSLRALPPGPNGDFASVELPGEDPLSGDIKRFDPYAYTFSPRLPAATTTAFDNPADKASNEESDE